MAQATVIGETVRVNGELTSHEDITIHGEVKGKIASDQHIFLESSGRIEAEVNTNLMDVHGTMVGNVVASDKFELHTDGRMTGDIKAPRVLIADGAKFKGNIEMG